MRARPAAGERAEATADRPVEAGSGRGFAQSVAALRHRNYALFWSGALISNAGTWMQNATVPFALLYVMKTSSTWVGFATMALVLPQLLLGPFAGALADRFPRRTVIISCQTVQAGFAAVMWVAWISDVRSPLVYVLLVLGAGAANGLNMPSWQAFVSELVPREVLLNAITLNSAQFNAARALGPAATGFVLARYGPSLAFLVNALSYIFVVAALLLIRVPRLVHKTERDPVLQEFVEGLRYIKGHAGIAVPIMVGTGLGLLALPVGQTSAIMAERVFELDAGRYGLLLGSYGVGAVFGAFVLGVIGTSISRGRLVRFWVLVFALALTVFATAPGFYVGLIGLAMCGMCFLGTYAILNTTVQMHVPERLRGRVLAVYVMGFSASFPLGTLVQSYLAGQIGMRATLLGSALLTGLLGAVLVLRPRYVREMDAAPAEAG